VIGQCQHMIEGGLVEQSVDRDMVHKHEQDRIMTAAAIAATENV
jgi:hypothetical protein